MAMLSARGVEVDTIDELIAADLANATIERVGRRDRDYARKDHGGWTPGVV